MWGQGTEQDLQHVRYAGAVWRSLSLLMPQSEYLLAKAFQEKRILPSIYSSCGHYFIQSEGNRPWNNSSWTDRVRYALDVLNLLQRIDTDLPDHLLMCDIHSNNFGVCGNGSLRVIDSDKLIFNSSFPHLRKGRCWKDSHCMMVGPRCPGTCNTELGKCVMKDNINLEVRQSTRIG
nr:hypothetical protein BaRGS_017965 [Batillaria attramentaria]